MVGKRMVLAFLVAVFVVGLLTCAAWAETSGAGAYYPSNMHRHPWFPWVMAASVVGWVTGQLKNVGGVKEWLERYWTRVPLWLIFVGDFLLFAVVGGYIGTGIYRPDDFVQALAAGVSWPLGLAGMVSRKN